jgi:hypothetical protein
MRLCTRGDVVPVVLGAQPHAGEPLLRGHAGSPCRAAVREQRRVPRFSPLPAHNPPHLLPLAVESTRESLEGRRSAAAATSSELEARLPMLEEALREVSCAGAYCSACIVRPAGTRGCCLVTRIAHSGGSAELSTSPLSSHPPPPCVSTLPCAQAEAALADSRGRMAAADAACEEAHRVLQQAEVSTAGTYVHSGWCGATGSSQGSSLNKGGEALECCCTLTLTLCSAPHHAGCQGRGACCC